MLLAAKAAPIAVPQVSTAESGGVPMPTLESDPAPAARDANLPAVAPA